MESVTKDTYIAFRIEDDGTVWGTKESPWLRAVHESYSFHMEMLDGGFIANPPWVEFYAKISRKGRDGHVAAVYSAWEIPQIFPNYYENHHYNGAIPWPGTSITRSLIAKEMEQYKKLKEEPSRDTWKEAAIALAQTILFTPTTAKDDSHPEEHSS